MCVIEDIKEKLRILRSQANDSNRYLDIFINNSVFLNIQPLVKEAICEIIISNLKYISLDMEETFDKFTKNRLYKKTDSTINIKKVTQEELYDMTHDFHESHGEQSFANLDLSGLDLSGLDLQGASFVGSYLIGANLKGSDFSYSNFRKANLTRADLTQSDLSWSNFTGADLTDAILTAADFTDAILTAADFKNSIGYELKLREK